MRGTAKVASAGPEVSVDDALHARLEELTNDLAGELKHQGKLDALKLAALRDLNDLMRARARSQQRSVRSTWTFFILMLLMSAGLLVAATLKRASTEATLTLDVGVVNLTVAPSQVPTRSLFAPSEWMEADVRTASFPATCALPSVPADSGERVRISANRASPLGLGDDDQIVKQLALTYDSPSDTTVALAVSGDAEGEHTLPVSVGVPRGTASSTTSEFAGAPTCDLTGDQVDLRAYRVAFAPTESIGPVLVNGFDFDEQRLIGTKEYSVSTIRTGRIVFATAPALPVEIATGALTRFDVTGPTVLALTPIAGGMRVTVRGRFANATISDREVRPSYLEEAWNHPFLKLLVAALSALSALVLGLARRFGASV